MGPSRSKDREVYSILLNSVALFEFSVCPNPRRQRAARPEMRNRPCPLSAFPQRFAKIKNLQAVGLDSADPPPYRSSSAGGGVGSWESKGFLRPWYKPPVILPLGLVDFSRYPITRRNISARLDNHFDPSQKSDYPTANKVITSNEEPDFDTIRERKTG